jgi:hypothetical protein
MLFFNYVMLSLLMNIQKIIIYGGLLLDVIGISIIIPAFPELKTFYHINDFQVTI